MAEFGAHLTAAGAEGDEKPSIFEVLAQESLMTAVRPAVKHASKILAERNPARYGWLYRFNDEIYTLLDTLLQHHYLRTYGSSFAENFYGLKRIPIHGGKLGHQHQLKSLMFLTLLPYLKLKLDQRFETLQEQEADSGGIISDAIQEQSLWKKLERIFRIVYPYVHMGWEGAMLYYQFAYIFDKSQYHSPLLHLAGVKLCNLSAEDIQVQQNKGALETLVGGGGSNQGNIATFLGKAAAFTAVSVSSALSVGVFFLQFLEWWYSEENQNTARAVSSLPAPPPPAVKHDSTTPHFHPSVCPICGRVRTNDTALSTSGHVFCYPCIYNFVQKHQRCPITGYSSAINHLIKLYLPD
ncbi:peroxisome assembly protein 12-like isoform X1 [Branchiostoma floridae x Branchiostoma belcheri]